MMRNKKLGLVALVIATLMISSVSATIVLMNWMAFYRVDYDGPPKAVASTTLKTYTFGGFDYGGQYVKFTDSNVITVNTIAPIIVEFYVEDTSDLTGLETFPGTWIGYAGDWKQIIDKGTANMVTFSVSGSLSYTFDIEIGATAKYYATEAESGFIQINAAVITP